MEFNDIRIQLTDTRDELLEILHGLSESQINKRQDSSRWSINQICQHLIKTEELYVYVIRKGLKSDEDSSTARKSLDFLLDRSRKIEAPDMAKPSEENVAYQEIIDKLHQSRAKLNEILDNLEDPSVLSRRHFVHPVFKDMLLIEWVRSLYMHEQRHMEQILESVRAN